MASLVPMPEAAMDKDDDAEPSQDDVRASRQALVVETVAQPGCMQVPAHGQLGLGVPPSDSAHHASAGCWINDIHQSSIPSQVNSALAAGIPVQQRTALRTAVPWLSGHEVGPRRAAW